MKKRASDHRYKYKLLDFLLKLEGADYEIALKFLPEFCQCRPDTFKEWIYIKSGDSRSIPADALVRISMFFQVNPIELYNEMITWDEVKDLFEAYKENNPKVVKRAMP